ncbi:MAG TPA: type II secretion system minor pseudopilin GspI [Steroidobacteraceae bacterium]|nr:type II secretion system minor pseudopilin GspI [Steroidobacteraceae bacterium]
MRARGFTLIEVLVALAIVAIGMAAVLETLTSAADTVVYLRDKTFANWIALNQIALQRLAGQQPAQGESDGDVDFAGRKWHWQQEVTGAQLPGVARIDVSVRPAGVEADKDRNWYATLSGIWGDAVGAPRGDLPDWGSQLLAVPAAGAPGTPTAPGTPAGPGPRGTP